MRDDALLYVCSVKYQMEDTFLFFSFNTLSIRPELCIIGDDCVKFESGKAICVALTIPQQASKLFFSIQSDYI